MNDVLCKLKKHEYKKINKTQIENVYYNEKLNVSLCNKSFMNTNTLKRDIKNLNEKFKGNKNNSLKQQKWSLICILLKILYPRYEENGDTFSLKQKVRFEYIDIFTKEKELFKQNSVLQKNKILLNLQTIEEDITLQTFVAIMKMNQMNFFISNEQFFMCITHYNCKDVFFVNEGNMNLKTYSFGEEIERIYKEYSKNRLEVKNPSKIIYSISGYKKQDIYDISITLRVPNIDEKMNKVVLYDKLIEHISTSSCFIIN